MASIRREIVTAARPEDVWAAICDIGALHTRLVPGFVVDTRLEPGARMLPNEIADTIRGMIEQAIWRL